MVKIALLRQCVPGRTFDHFRPEGYDIVAIIDVESDLQFSRDDLQRIVDSKVHKPSKAHSR